MKKEISRRAFVKRGSMALAAGSILLSTSAKSYSNILGSNDAINIAIIGVRIRGTNHITDFAKVKNVRIKYLVDIDENLFEKGLTHTEKVAGYRPETATDMRTVFDDKDIDAVSIATPNHWHALSTIWAAQAGKHVFVEKPSSHNIWEGRKMIEAARKYNVLVQVGFQNRSILNTNKAIKFIRDGKLGDVYLTRGLCFKPRPSIGSYPDGPMKEGEKFRINLEKKSYEPPYTKEYLSKVDYDMWLGPAPESPFNRNRFHYNWHWNWAYGNGDTGNQGPHQFDVARWALGKDDLPIKVSSHGGYFVYKSAQETPNTQTSVFEYEDGKILEFSTRGLFTNPEGIQASGVKPLKIGTLIFGSEGWMQIDGGGNWQTFFGRKSEAGPTSGEQDDSYDPLDLAGGGSSEIFNNFINAVQSGKRSDLSCDIETGHLSTILPLMADISYKVGRDLKLDGKQESFIDDAEANKLLTRDYREGYVVPENV
ncbi:MAG: Gfo/Idh/MocA family oxidoreductase [Melioribacteraceae bacterium]|nr:Gfo/Idh/MocA family oxidoreductase [Melioribacteraceae bacterium]